MQFSPIHFSELYKSLAYLDPGSGSLLVQLAVAAILGFGVLVRSQWARIKRWFGGKTIESNDEGNDENYDE
jgi:hypothetical protein